MGIVYNAKFGSGYINKPICRETVSRQPLLRALTRQNVELLVNLGLRVTPRGSGNFGK